MEIQSFTADDLNQLPGLQPKDWPDITPAYRYYVDASYCFPVKVMMDQTMVGIGTTIVHHDVAWLAHIIVREDLRRQGIGQFITQSLVDSLTTTPCDTIYLLATDLGMPVYLKLGFEKETEYLFFNGRKTDAAVSVQQVIPYRAEFHDQVADLDAAASGEDRMFHLEEFLHDALVYHDGTDVLGFYLPPFGDGLIVASTVDAGIALLEHHLAVRDRVSFPVENSAASKFLQDKGWSEIRTAVRMRLGKARAMNLANIFNRIGGNLG